jgi:hypothetical protein
LKKIFCLAICGFCGFSCIYVGDKFPAGTGSGVLSYTNNGIKQWSRLDGVASRVTMAIAVALDAAGNSYITGNSSGNPGLDGQAQVSAGGDVFVTKYDIDGNRLWTTLLGAAGNQSSFSNGIALDASGNVFVSGVASGDFGGATQTGAQDLFLLKLDNSGALQWTQMRGAVGATFETYGLAADASGNLYVAGAVSPAPTVLDSQTVTGTEDFFTIKYDNSGNHQWTRFLGVPGKSTSGRGVASDAAGNVYVTGQTWGALDGQPFSAATGDLFLVKYDTNGNKQWTNVGTATNIALGLSVATDPEGNIYAAGFFQSGTFNGISPNGSQDALVVKYDPSGAKLWTTLLGVTGKFTDGLAVTADAGGNSYVSGFTEGNLLGELNIGLQDAFLTKLDASGQPVFTRLLGRAGAMVKTNGIAYSPMGILCVVGTSESGGGIDSLPPIGIADFFIAQYR